MTKTKITTINFNHENGIFSSIMNKINGTKQLNIANLRQALSNEKARLLHIVKLKKPTSIYDLSKILNRDFNTVYQDVKLLERFGFIKLIKFFKNGRDRLQPVVDVDQVVIAINI